jgi:hypothetical protein
LPSSSKSRFKKIKLHDLVEKTKQDYVLPKLINCMSTTISFDLWMSRGAHDIFVLVIDLMGFDW